MKSSYSAVGNRLTPALDEKRSVSRPSAVNSTPSILAFAAFASVCTITPLSVVRLHLQVVVLVRVGRRSQVDAADPRLGADFDRVDFFRIHRECPLASAL